MPLSTDDPDVVERGYVTEDDYHWVCESCFGDFRERFAWSTGRLIRRGSRHERACLVALW
jgi:hypothetical protein